MNKINFSSLSLPTVAKTSGNFCGHETLLLSVLRDQGYESLKLGDFFSFLPDAIRKYGRDHDRWEYESFVQA